MSNSQKIQLGKLRRAEPSGNREDAHWRNGRILQHEVDQDLVELFVTFLQGIDAAQIKLEAELTRVGKPGGKRVAQAWRHLEAVKSAFEKTTGYGFDGTELVRIDEDACRVCGCTDEDCSGCIARTGAPCTWVEHDLCSACVTSADTRQSTGGAT